MSAQIGDRATYRGQSVIVVSRAHFLGERRWWVRYRNGKAPTGWTREEAPESALASRTRPSWDVGDSVRVGWMPYRVTGTVAAITIDEAGRTLYSVTIPESIEKTEEGTRYRREAFDVLVGAEALDTGTT